MVVTFIGWKKSIDRIISSPDFIFSVRCIVHFENNSPCSVDFTRVFSYNKSLLQHVHYQQ